MQMWAQLSPVPVQVVSPFPVQMDLRGVSTVPVQMCAQVSPVPVQMWAECHSGAAYDVLLVVQRC